MPISIALAQKALFVRNECTDHLRSVHFGSPDILYHRYTYFISASLEVAETPNPEKAFPIESPTSANVSDVFFTLKMFETTRYNVLISYK